MVPIQAGAAARRRERGTRLAESMPRGCVRDGYGDGGGARGLIAERDDAKADADADDDDDDDDVGEAIDISLPSTVIVETPVWIVKL